MAHYLLQIVKFGIEIACKALVRSVKQEYQASQQAAAMRREMGGFHASGDQTSDGRIVAGISLEEARQILNVTPETKPEEIQKKFDYLFHVNDKTKGGSFYIQSKVYRAHERLMKDFIPTSSSTSAERPKKEDSGDKKQTQK